LKPIQLRVGHASPLADMSDRDIHFKTFCTQLTGFTRLVSVTTHQWLPAGRTGYRWNDGW